MKLRTLYLTKEQDKTLRSLKDLTVSEHIRRAIDEYLERIIKLKISTSKS